jgi:hypothetical protein
MTAEPRFVVIRAFTSPIEAHLACSALKGAGIDARLSDIHLVEAQWMYSNAIGGVKVWVPAADEEAARELLDPALRRTRCRHCGHVFALEPGTQNPEP